MLRIIHAMKIEESFEIYLHYRHEGLPVLSFLLSLRSESYFSSLCFKVTQVILIIPYP
jgi:hypothetical protein